MSSFLLSHAQTGRVMVDGIDLSGLDAEALHRSVHWLSAWDPLHSGSLLPGRSLSQQLLAALARSESDIDNNDRPPEPANSEDSTDAIAAAVGLRRRGPGHTETPRPRARSNASAGAESGTTTDTVPSASASAECDDEARTLLVIFLCRMFVHVDTMDQLLESAFGYAYALFVRWCFQEKSAREKERGAKAKERTPSLKK